MIPCNVRMRGIRVVGHILLFECNCEIASNYIFKYIKYIMKVTFFTVFHAGRMHERQNEKHVSTIEFGWLGLGLGLWVVLTLTIALTLIKNLTLTLTQILPRP